MLNPLAFAVHYFLLQFIALKSKPAY